MGSLAIFDRQLRLDWWRQEELMKTSVFVITDMPISYIFALGLIAVGFGRIYLIGAHDVYRFKILYQEYTGDLFKGFKRFVDNELGRYLKNYRLEIIPISINLASNQATNLVLKLIEMDDNPHKILVDVSSNYIVKRFVRKLVEKTKIMSYVLSFSGDLAIYAFSDLEYERLGLMPRREMGVFSEIYSRAIKSSARPEPHEHLMVLASGLILGEVALRVQGVSSDVYVPTLEIRYPFEGLGSLAPYSGSYRKVVIVGAGALGTFYAIQLAIMQNMHMIDIKRVVFVDPDKIELVNFNRQVLYWGKTIGLSKAEVIAERYRRMVYAEVETEFYEAKFGEVKDHLRDTDLIIDGVDNWAARKEIASFAIENKIPLISAGVELLGGHETFYVPQKTYCPFHSIDLASKKDPPERESCLMIEPSVIFTNMTMASLAILNSIGLREPLNGVLYYSLRGIYSIYKRFHLDKFKGSCGD